MAVGFRSLVNPDLATKISTTTSEGLYSSILTKNHTFKFTLKLEKDHDILDVRYMSIALKSNNVLSRLYSSIFLKFYIFPVT